MSVYKLRDVNSVPGGRPCESVLMAVRLKLMDVKKYHDIPP